MKRLDSFTSMDRNNSNVLAVPLTVHFLLELSMWLWLLLATILKSIFYILGLIVTIIIFSAFSARSDPIKHTHFKVNGIVLFSLEIFSFLLGIIACWALFGEIGLLLRTLFTVFSYVLNYQRILWLFGVKSEIPKTMQFFMNSGKP